MIFDSPAMTRLDDGYATASDMPYAVLLNRADDAAEHRAQLERIVASAPDGVRKRWTKDLVSSDNGSFVGAWFEVMMFDWLNCIGNVIPSPTVSGNHPDFLLSTNGQSIVVECKVLRFPENDRQVQQKIGPLLESLNAIPAPYLITVSPIHLGRELDLQSAVQAVNDWLRRNPDEPLCYCDSKENNIRFSACVLDDDAAEVCTVLEEAPDMESDDPVIGVSRLASALDDKANQHPALQKADYPYVIAIFHEEPLITPRSVVRAWRGEERLSISPTDGKVVNYRFDKSGIGYQDGEAVHTSVSGILLCGCHREADTRQMALDCQYVSNKNAAILIDSRVFMRKT